MQGDADRAVRILSAYVDQDKNPIFLLDLAGALTMRGEYAKALKAIDEALAAKNATPRRSMKMSRLTSRRRRIIARFTATATTSSSPPRI